MKSWVPLALALALGLVAALMVRAILAERGMSKHAGETLQAVAIARHDIDPGHVLGAEDLAMGRVAADAVPSGSYSDIAPLSGRVAVLRLSKGQPVMENFLAPVGAGSGLQALVPKGMRAMTIDVSEVSSVGGMILPGSRVDVICNVRDEKTKETAARTVEQNLKVTAIGRQLSPPDANGQPTPPFNNVTLLVTPRQAQTLQLASQMGRPWLVLRGNGDSEELDPQSTSLADLRGDRNQGEIPVLPANDFSTTQPAARAALNVRMIEIIRGATQTEVPMPTPMKSALMSGADAAPVVR